MNTLGYQVKILSLPKEDGGGYIAIVPELPGCMADGNTPEDALKATEEAIKSWIEVEKEDGGIIPEPEGYKAYSEYSGRIGLRLPKWLHAKIAIAADNQGCSINQFIQNAIAFSLGIIEGKKEDKKDIMSVTTVKLKNRANWGDVFESVDQCEDWHQYLLPVDNDSGLNRYETRFILNSIDRRK